MIIEVTDTTADRRSGRDCAILPMALVWFLERRAGGLPCDAEALQEALAGETIKSDTSAFRRTRAFDLRREFRDLLNALANTKTNPRAKEKAAQQRGTETRCLRAYLGSMLTRDTHMYGAFDLGKAFKDNIDDVLIYHDFLARNVRKMVSTVILGAFEGRKGYEAKTLKSLFKASGWTGAMRQLHHILRNAVRLRDDPKAKTMRLAKTAVFRDILEDLVPTVIMPHLGTGDFDHIVKVAKALPRLTDEGRWRKFFDPSATTGAQNMRLIVSEHLGSYVKRFFRVMARFCDDDDDPRPIHFRGSARSFAEHFLGIEGEEDDAESEEDDRRSVLNTPHARRLIEESDELYSKRAAAAAADKKKDLKDDDTRSQMWALREEYGARFHSEVPAGGEPRSAYDAVVAQKFIEERYVVLEASLEKAKPLPFDELCIRLMDVSFPYIFDALYKDAKGLRRSRRGREASLQEEIQVHILLELMDMNERLGVYYAAAKERRRREQAARKEAAKNRTARSRSGSDDIPYDELEDELERDAAEGLLNLDMGEDKKDSNANDDDSDSLFGAARTGVAKTPPAGKKKKKTKQSSGTGYLHLVLSRHITIAPMVKGFKMHFFTMTAGTFPNVLAVCATLAGKDLQPEQLRRDQRLEEWFKVDTHELRRACYETPFDRTMRTDGVAFQWLVRRRTSTGDAGEETRSYLPRFQPDDDGNDSEDQPPEGGEIHEEEVVDYSEEEEDDDSPVPEDAEPVGAGRAPTTPSGPGSIHGGAPRTTKASRGAKARTSEEEKFIAEMKKREVERWKQGIIDFREAHPDADFDDVYAMDWGPRGCMVFHAETKGDPELRAKYLEYEQRRRDERRCDLPQGELGDGPHCRRHAGVFQITVADFYGDGGIRAHVKRRNAAWAQRNDKPEEEKAADLEELEEEEKKVIRTFDDALRDWTDMLERLPAGFYVENTRNRRRDREKLRSVQRRWLDKWIMRLAPPGKKVLYIIGDYVTRWLGPKQPIIFGGDFVPMKALFLALGRQPGVAIYIPDEHGTTHTCSACGAWCDKIKRAKKKNGEDGADVWRILRCTNADCGITWHRDVNAVWNTAWKGLSDLYPERYPRERLYAGLNPRPDDIRRFRTAIADVEDRYAKRRKGHYSH